ncbi:hypothetical protein JCM17380_47520 [Desulfosporosinus burensis]
MNYFERDIVYLRFLTNSLRGIERERGGVMSVLDFKAAQKWAKLPRTIQELIENNVFCSAKFLT